MGVGCVMQGVGVCHVGVGWGRVGCHAGVGWGCVM